MKGSGKGLCRRRLRANESLTIGLRVTELTGPMADWPSHDLQTVDACPACGCTQRELLHEAVADWTFWSAPGRWRYQRCLDCQSVYLDPRPTPDTIGRAYATYYTHEGPGSASGVKSLKLRWKNERLSARWGRDLQPRLGLPAWLTGFARRRGERMALPFGWQELAGLAPGRLVDVGCGSGATVALAAQLGWQAQGIEMDDAAVRSAQAFGLAVEQGGYERLSAYPGAFDAVVCSHVIEHVFDPRAMVRLMWDALRPGGVLLLSTPNALSDLHRHFGADWRGLEAPRHLVLFTEVQLSRLLTAQGFEVGSRSDEVLETARDSARIRRRARRVSKEDRAEARRLARELPRSADGQDFIKLVARRPG